METSMTEHEDEYLLKNYQHEKYGASRISSCDKIRPLKSHHQSSHLNCKRTHSNKGFSRVFAYSTYFDKFLIIIGCLTAIIHGLGIPFLAYTFGEMTSYFLEAQREYSSDQPDPFLNIFSDVETEFIQFDEHNKNASILITSTAAATDVRLFTNGNHSTAVPTPVLPAHIEWKAQNITVRNIIVPGQLINENSSVYNDYLHHDDQSNTIINESSINLENNSIPFSEKENESSIAFPNKNFSSSIFSNVFNSTQDFTSFLRDAIYKYVMIYIFLGLVMMVSAYSQVLCWQLSCEQQMFLLHQDFFYQVLRQDSLWFSNHQSKSVILNLIIDLKKIHNGIGLKFGNFIQYLSTLITSLAISFSIQWQLTAVALTPTLILAIILGFIGKYLDIFSQQEENVLNICNKHITDTLSCIRTVVAYMGHHIETKKFQDLLDTAKKTANKRHILHGLSLGIVFLTMYCIYAIVCWYGVYLHNQRELSHSGTVFIVAFCIMIAFFALGNIISNFQALIAADSASAHIFSIVNEMPHIDAYSFVGSCPVAVRGSLKFSNVSFTRPSADLTSKGKLEMIRHMTLTMKAGQVIALVGSDDCGKDLIKELLLRFYDPIEGQIYLDGHDLKTLNVHWLRNAISVIERNPVFFEKMVIENIVTGSDSVTFEEVVKEAKLLHTHDYILSLPNGYATVMEQKDVNIANEVKQLIAMVRASLRKPKIILIEESFETFDQNNITVFNTALEMLRKGKTIIILAKRLSSVKKADHVVVLQDGWIINQGSYQELSNQDVLCHYFLKNSILIDDSNDFALDKKESQAPEDKFSLSAVHKRRSSSWIPTELLKDVACQPNKIKYLWRILVHFSHDYKYFFLGCICAILFGFSSPVAAFLLAEIFYLFSKEFPTSQDTNVISIAFILLASFSCIIYTLRTSCFQIMSEKLIQQLRITAFNNILHQPLKWLEEEEHNPQNLANSLTDKTLKMALDSGFGSFISMITCLLTGIIMGLFYGWQMAVAIISSVFLLIIFGAILIKLALCKQHIYITFMNEASKIIFEAVQKLWTIQALTMEQKILEAYIDKLTVPYFMSKKQVHLFAVVFALTQGMIYFLYSGIFLLSLHLILQEINTPAEIIRVFFSVAICIISLVQILKLWLIYDKICDSAKDLFHFTDLTLLENTSIKDGFKPDIKGAVNFKGVYFCYSTRMDFPLLQGVDLKVKPLQTVAVIGAGSHIILDLTIRLYDPLIGQIMIDNFGVHQLTLSHLRKNIVLLADPLIIPGTLYENIIYGADESMLNSNKMDAAIKLSGITEFVWDLPQGWNTVLGENGTILRRKDQIRIGLARICLRDPRILLVGDIFKTVIPEDMPMILKAFRNISKGRSCIVTTKAVGILRSADWIVVLDKGIVQEQGKHEDLFAKRSVYYTLYHQHANGLS